MLQGQFFSLDAFDHVFDDLYCRYDEGANGQTGPHAADHPPCLDGGLRHAWPLESIKALWDEYPDVPKVSDW